MRMKCTLKVLSKMFDQEMVVVGVGAVQASPAHLSEMTSFTQACIFKAFASRQGFSGKVFHGSKNKNNSNTTITAATSTTRTKILHYSSRFVFNLVCLFIIIILNAFDVAVMSFICAFFFFFFLIDDLWKSRGLRSVSACGCSAE